MTVWEIHELPANPAPVVTAADAATDAVAPAAVAANSLTREGDPCRRHVCEL